MLDTKRLAPEIRRDQLLSVALTLAAESHYQRITRDDIAARAGVAPTLISRYFGTMPQLRRDIMRAAVRARNLAIIAQGLAVRDPHAQKAPGDLQREAVATLVSSSK